MIEMNMKELAKTTRPQFKECTLLGLINKCVIFGYQKTRSVSKSNVFHLVT